VRKGLTPAALTLALALATASCEPVSAPGPALGGGAAASSANPGVTSHSTPRDVRVDLLEAALRERDARIRDLTSTVAKLVERLDQLEQANSAMKQDIERASQMTRQDLDAALRTLEALRAASPLPNLAYDVPKIEARVLSIERGAEGPRVLLDVGKKQGVEPRYEFTISRGGQAIAKVAVDRVEAEIASARVVYAKDGASIAEGDLATTRP
jgi:hypothetical protein